MHNSYIKILEFRLMSPDALACYSFGAFYIKLMI